MLDLINKALVALWLVWILGNAVLFIIGVLWAKYDGPHFDGFRIHVPLEYRQILTPDEYLAVVEHEKGHRAHMHVWKNLVRRFCFFPYTEMTRVEQELEADDYCTKPLALASALRKMSPHPFDLARAMRLEKRSK